MSEVQPSSPPAAASSEAEESTQVFRFLLLFRWLALVPALVLWLAPGFAGHQPASTPWVLALLALFNGMITLAHHPLNRLLRRFPLLLGLDLVLAAGVIALTGGITSALYFYALAPILAAAFFFGLRGGLLAAAAFTPLYGLAIMAGDRRGAGLAPSAIGLPFVLLQLFTLYGIGILFGYPAVLLAKLRRQARELAAAGRKLATSNAHLQHMNRQLHLIQELTLSLQSAVDPGEMQEVLLEGLVRDMGYPVAAVAIGDDENRLGEWRRREAGSSRSRRDDTILDLLQAAGTPVAQAIHEQRLKPCPAGQSPTGVAALDEMLGLPGPYVVLPMHLRGHLIGVLLVGLDAATATAAELTPLALIAGHASVALGSLRLCIERAQRLATEEVRNRIAADIHDSVSQQLFGLAYGLNACNQLLAQHPEALTQVKAQLADLEPLAFAALHQMRSTLWELLPGGLDARQLTTALRRHMAILAMNRPVALEITVTPAFDRWPPELRHQLFLIAQEGIANIARHAQARTAHLVIAQNNGQALLTIGDDGVGFDPDRVDDNGGFGLENMRRRVERLGGRFRRETAPGQGVRLTVTVPLPRP
jgi:signal transduction histidine kinase